MSAQENKSVARRYHQFNVDEMDEILSPGFIGYHSDGSIWNLSEHKKFWSSQENAMQDTIHVQVAEGQWVATRSTREGLYQGRTIRLDMMSFKHFVDGKIAEIWEQYNPQLVEE